MKRPRFLFSITACLSLIQGAVFAGEGSVAEFSPKEADAMGWRVVDDGVMGGLSRGKLQVSEEGVLKFSGKLSLENNGGFSSLRTNEVKLDLGAAKGLAVRVKGDGRTYQLRLGTDARFRGMEISFMAEFATEKGKWMEVEVPFQKLVGSFRGMTLKDEVFDPAKIRRVGLLLGDKKAGDFELEVDWIRSYGGGGEISNIVDAALADGRFGTLATALTKADLVGFLQGEGPFTVFAPTDKAFAALPKGTVENLLKPENLEQLQAILKYHVLAGATDLAGALGAKEAKTVSGELVKFGFSDGRVRVNDAAIMDADLRYSNGIIHVIDSVILPPAPVNDVASVAKQDGRFGTLLAALDAAGLSDVLSGEGPFTILAPTDEAFAALPKGTVESLLKPENVEQLKAILGLHAVAGKVSAGDALNAKRAKSVAGGALNFGIVKGAFQVNGATIMQADIQCDNGVLHVIDTVLLPAKGPKTAQGPLQRIELAIGQRVPLYNDGKPEECVAVYRECLLTLTKDGSLEADEAKLLLEVITRADKMEDISQRAWVLRAGLDRIYEGLARE